MHISKLPAGAIRSAKCHLKNLLEQSGWKTVAKALLYASLDLDAEKLSLISALKKVGVQLTVGEGRRVTVTDSAGTQEFVDDRWYSGIFFVLYELIGKYDLYFPFFSEGFTWESLNKGAGHVLGSVRDVRVYLCGLRATGQYNGLMVKLQGGEIKELRPCVFGSLEVPIEAIIRRKGKGGKVELMHLLLAMKIQVFLENCHLCDQREVDSFFKSQDGCAGRERKLLRTLRLEEPTWFDGSLQLPVLAFKIKRWLRTKGPTPPHEKWGCMLRSLFCPDGLNWIDRQRRGKFLTSGAERRAMGELK